MLNQTFSKAAIPLNLGLKKLTVTTLHTKTVPHLLNIFGEAGTYEKLQNPYQRL
jgi:hypothetical protein